MVAQPVGVLPRPVAAALAPALPAAGRADLRPFLGPVQMCADRGRVSCLLQYGSYRDGCGQLHQRFPDFLRICIVSFPFFVFFFFFFFFSTIEISHLLRYNKKYIPYWLYE